MEIFIYIMASNILDARHERVLVHYISKIWQIGGSMKHYSILNIIFYQNIAQGCFKSSFVSGEGLRSSFLHTMAEIYVYTCVLCDKQPMQFGGSWSLPPCGHH